jgi:hypothetical protein
LKIIRANHLDGYRVQLWFNNGEIRIADLSDSFDGPIFSQLRDISYFKKFTIPFNTLEWENGADFAPEYLYEISTPL